MNLKETLDQYSKSNMYPFHMPGHKRMLGGCYEIDMTEVDGVDDLHDPDGVIAAEQEKLARLYKAKKSFMLVGGSTVGNLSAIYSCCNEDDLILIQRNSHKSVYNGAILRHLRVGYIYPQVDDNGIYQAVTLEEIMESVEKEGEPKAIVLTSPTYEGFHCNLPKIWEYCKAQGILLIVDQAHGAHLGFNELFQGQGVEHSDITIQSLHKTLPCLTQTAALHVSSDRVDEAKVRQALDIFETSSPSYVLMNSISGCLEILENPEDYFEKYVDNLQDFYQVRGQLNHLSIPYESAEIKDPGKIVILTGATNITGVELAQILREKYEIETELSSFSYVLAMTSIMDTKEGFDRLKKALVEIDEALTDGSTKAPMIAISSAKAMEPWQAKANGSIQMPLEESKGKVSADMVCLYPPGAPVIVPGEIIDSQALELIGQAKEASIHVTGINNGVISVVN